jgi:predicted CoA-substrate-specific enzyme activase
MNIGFDFGSKNIGYAVVDDGKVLTGGVVPHFGNLKKHFSGLCADLFKKFDRSFLATYGITCGSHFEIRNSIDPVIASVEAGRFLNSGCRNIISVGHHSFYLVILNESGGYSEHVVNTDCSSGTGSFIDQQAERLGLTTDEMSRIAYEFIGKVPPIATRCTVFAKSDIIHAQASGYSKEAISAGICAGAARCVIDNILKGRKLEGKTLLIGGMAQNGLVVRLLSDEIGKELAVSEHSEYFNAIGSALAGRSSGKDFDPQNIMEGIKNVKKVQNRLEMKLTEYPDFNEDRNYVTEGVEAAVYSKLEKDSYSVTLGIDVGSTSTKLLAMDENEKILLGLYTRTKSEPVKAVQSLFRELGKLFDGKKINFKGVGVTGSGRSLVRSVIGADDAVNEITAHARGAAYIDPEVDSIIEIGGQDSKYTIVKDGMVIHTVMNYVCAAGTGSFIEEQAKRLDIPLERLSDMAIGSSGPFTSERCTVYMERDLNVLQRQGQLSFKDRRQTSSRRQDLFPGCNSKKQSAGRRV